MSQRLSVGQAPPAGRKADPEDVHVRFLYAALGFGVLGGFTLAVSLPVQAALGRMSLSWIAHAQVHGHLQVIGFAGLFVAGVAYKLAPRFGSGRLAYPSLAYPVWLCLVAGVLLRALGQPLADEPAFAALLVAGVALEVTGAVLFAAMIAATLWPATKQRSPTAVLMTAGAGWFVAQAILGAWWLGGLALEGATVLVSDRNAVLLTMQFYGFLLCVFAGVGLRSFPTFFGMPQPSQRFGLAAAAMLQAGLGLWVVAGLLAVRGVDAGTAAAAGQALTGAGVLVLVSAFGWWRREMRLAAASQPLSWALRGVLASLTLTGALLAGSGVQGAFGPGWVASGTSDAIRHVFALGVVTLGIVAMAQLILPEFASERMVRRPGRWRGAAFASALLAAAILRGIVPLLGVEGTTRYWLMAVAGLLALGSVAIFAWFYLRARRSHVAYMRRVTQWRASSVPTVE